MGIPPIRRYPMPEQDDLPLPVPAWRPEPDRAVLLVHDMQRYFVDLLPRNDSPTVDLLANVARLRRAATAAGIPVLYTAQPGRVGRAERGLLHDFWGPGMGTDPAVREIVPEVAPAPGDVVVRKHRYSAFHDTNLAALLRGYRRDQLVICGVYAHIGCLATALDAYSRDIEPFLVADAVADFSAADHRFALDHAARTCAVVVRTADLLEKVALHDAGQLHA
jgi:trans-2,3-dihydro-3-hydroxyanthranilic acid synthase